MLRTVLLTLPILAATSAAGQQEDLTWMAVEGDTLNLNGRIMAVRGVSCPPSSEAAGLNAMRLTNTFLRGGMVVCATSRDGNGRETVDCAKRGNNGLSLSQMLIFSNLCTPRRNEDCMVPHFDALPTYTLPPSAQDA